MIPLTWRQKEHSLLISFDRNKCKCFRPASCSTLSSICLSLFCRIKMLSINRVFVATQQDQKCLTAGHCHLPAPTILCKTMSAWFVLSTDTSGSLFCTKLLEKISDVRPWSRTNEKAACARATVHVSVVLGILQVIRRRGVIWMCACVCMCAGSGKLSSSICPSSCFCQG